MPNSMRISSVVMKCVASFLIACAGGRALAQAQAQKFEVASVKPNTSGERNISIGMEPGGRFTARNVPLRLLILNAYRLQDFQLVGGPDWIASERFDITAKGYGDFTPPTPGGPAGGAQLMMRSLLEERFQLATHQETRTLPIYALVLAREDKKLGPQLKVSPVDCVALAGVRRQGGPPPAFAPGEPRPCSTRMAPGMLSANGFPISNLAQTLSQSVGRFVVDRTGLTGNFDVELSWAPDQGPQGGDVTGASIFTALQEQLGLKLESTRGPVDVTVIDRVERPTPD
jgi:uncharacterized protein (TIGR03435 family)